LTEAEAGKTSYMRIAFVWYASVVAVGLLVAFLVAVAD